MGYMHISNLAKNVVILLFRECYAMEKIHGTSVHITFERLPEAPQTKLTFFSGGASQNAFEALFDKAKLAEEFLKLGHEKLTIYGEAYGGSMQKMSHVYGPKLKFIAFEALHGVETWCDVPTAEKLALALGLEFVPYARTPTDLAVLDELRRQNSIVALRQGMGQHLPEGIVLRPLVEMRDHRGNRVIVKYKNPEFSERGSKRDTIVNPDKALELANADAVATEWVTDMRLAHVLDKMNPPAVALSDIPRLVTAMLEDVGREGAGEVDVTVKLVKQAIGTRTVKLFKAKLAAELVPA